MILLYRMILVTHILCVSATQENIDFNNHNNRCVNNQYMQQEKYYNSFPQTSNFNESIPSSVNPSDVINTQMPYGTEDDFDPILYGFSIPSELMDLSHSDVLNVLENDNTVPNTCSTSSQNMSAINSNHNTYSNVHPSNFANPTTYTAEHVQNNSSNPIEITTSSYNYSNISYTSAEVTSISTSTSPLYFKDISNEDIVFVYIHNGFTLSYRIEEKLKKHRVLWMYIENNKGNNIKHIKKCILSSSSNTSLIFQWGCSLDTDSISEYSLFASYKLFTILKDTGIDFYIPPFLLFIDPNSGFLGNIFIDYTLIYRLFFPKPNSLVLFRKYSSLYFLHTYNSKIPPKVKKTKVYRNMYYYRFLHLDLKYYGVVNMKKYVFIPINQIFISTLIKIPTSLDYVLIRQPYRSANIKFLNSFFSINSKQMDIFSDVLRKAYIVAPIPIIILEHLVIRDIILNFIQKNKEFEGFKEKMKKENYVFLSQSIYPDYIISIFYYSLYIYKNILTDLCPTITNLELYFIDSSNISIPSMITINLEELNILFAFSAISFFDAKHIYLNLPSSYSLDQLHTLFSSPNFIPFSIEKIDEAIKLETLTHSHVKKAIISSPDILSVINTNQILLTKFWYVKSNNFLSSSPKYVQILCNILMEYGFFLSSPSTQTITLNNRNNSITLFSFDTTSPFTISFEGSKKTLCFKYFYLPTNPNSNIAVNSSSRMTNKYS